MVQWGKGFSVATAMACVQSLTRELPYATDAVIKKKKKTKKQKNKFYLKKENDESQILKVFLKGRRSRNIVK